MIVNFERERERERESGKLREGGVVGFGFFGN